MIYLSIKTVFHQIEKNNPPAYGIQDVEHSSIEEYLPYFYNKEKDEFDVYLFVINRVYSKNTEINSLYYKLETKKSLFFLLKHIEKNNPKTNEMLDYWRAQRRDSDYYLELIFETVTNELIHDYIELVMKWCKKNGEIENSSEFRIPEAINHNNHNQIDIPIEFIEKTEMKNKKKPKGKPIYWDTGYPGFEGVGSDSALTWLSLGISGISFLLTYYGLIKQRENFKDKRRVKKIRKEIYTNFNVIGNIQDPDVNCIETDKNLNRVYRFTEIYNNKPISYYIAKLNIPRFLKMRKAKFDISKESIET